MKTRILFLITLLCAAFQDMLSQNSNNLWKWIAPKIHRMAVLPAVVAFTLLFHAAPAQATSIYVTASGDTSVFGTLDLATGQFSQIATTNQGFSGLTTGSGGTIYGTDVVSGHLYTISPAGVTTQFGSRYSAAGAIWL